ncbi:MAG: PadR family transcriptional regulator [Planctomycetota bacterium]
MNQLVKGTLELLILDTVAEAPTYGYRICQSVLARSEQTIELREGSLYPALHKLERQKLLKAKWQTTAEGRRRKYYQLTPAGRRKLEQKLSQWRTFSRAIDRTLRGLSTAGAGHA